VGCIHSSEGGELMEKIFKKIRTNQIYKGEVVEVIHQKVHFDGKKNGVIYEYLKRPAIAIIVPVDGSGDLFLTYQYRAALNKYIWEFPAGQSNPSENIRDTAIRELKEESGITPSSMELIGEIHTSPHFSDEKAYIFLAKNLQIGAPNLEDKEIIQTYKLSIKDIENKIQSGVITDAKTLIAFRAYIRYRDEIKEIL